MAKHSGDYGNLTERTKMRVADKRGPSAGFPGSRTDPGAGKSKRLYGMRNPKQGSRGPTKSNPFPENR